jgi:hypothetical protein
MLLKVERNVRHLTITIIPAELRGRNRAVSFLERRGLIRMLGGNLNFTAYARRAALEYSSVAGEQGKFVVAEQHVERLTLLSEDEERNPLCVHFGGGDDAYGYIGHITSYTELGSDLEKAQLLYEGYGDGDIGLGHPVVPTSTIVDGIYQERHDYPNHGSQSGEHFGFPWEFHDTSAST